MDQLMALGAASLLARVGLALYMMGMVRAKNSAGAVLRAICDFCVVSLAFWAVGAALLFPDSTGWMGLHTDYFLGRHISPERTPTVFFYLTVILMGTGALSGAVAERFRFFPLCTMSAILGGVILPLGLRWSWAGWAAHKGFLDIGGAAAIHVAVGVSGAVAIWLVGARSGKYNRDGSTTMIPGHNVPMAGVGAFLIGIGWIPYLAGTCYPVGLAAPAALNVLLAGSAAGLSSLILGHSRYRKPDIVLSLLGFLGGIVSASAAAGAMPSWGAVLVGAIAGVIVPLASVSMDLIGKQDDPSGLVPIFIVGGSLATLSAGFFAPLAQGQSRIGQLLVQGICLLALSVFSAAVSFAVLFSLKLVVRIRAREADEFEGLDLAEHDIGAYPDFSQNMIKSYHLREI